MTPQELLALNPDFVAWLASIGNVRFCPPQSVLNQPGELTDPHTKPFDYIRVNLSIRGITPDVQLRFFENGFEIAEVESLDQLRLKFITPETYKAIVRAIPTKYLSQ